MTLVDKKVLGFLTKVVNLSEVHAKWLNTLSFMENMGTTKIYKSQSGLGMSRTVLQHAAEESRHALFFKKLINRHYGDACPTYDSEFLLCPFSSWMYFQRLDAMVDRNIQDHADKSYLKYLYVTLIIEERAASVYEIYEKVLIDSKTDISLKSVISEEEGHMDTTTAELKNLDSSYISRMDQFRKKEDVFFNKLLSSLENAIKDIQ